MLIKTILIPAFLWSGYSILPTVYYKFIYKERYQKNELQLTFDDGPNPIYTEQILDILKQHHTKAIFFFIT